MNDNGNCSPPMQMGIGHGIHMGPGGKFGMGHSSNIGPPPQGRVMMGPPMMGGPIPAAHIMLLPGDTGPGNPGSGPPMHLPLKQQELYIRIQQQQREHTINNEDSSKGMSEHWPQFSQLHFKHIELRLD